MKLPDKGTALSWAVAGSTALGAIFGGAAVESTIQNSNVEIHGQFSLIHNEQVVQPGAIPPSSLPTRACPLER